MASDLIERLKKCALGSADEDVMVRWDKIRAILKQDKGGTWPRDCFESIIDGYAEDCEDAVKEIASLRTALAIERERAEKAESALSAFDKERQTPEGWKLVPIEPTEAMLATQGKSRPDLARNDAIRRTAEALNAEARRMAAETWAEMIDAALSQRGTE